MTLNVAGLNNVIKWKRIAKGIKDLNLDIIFIRKTHLRQQAEKHLRIFKGQNFHAAAKTKTKGVLINISTKVNFHVIEVIKDVKGRFIVIVGSLE